MPTHFKTKRKIEFSDTDLAGIVHFARFFVFMETAEHEFLNSLGTSVATEIDDNKIGWPRLSAKCEYHKPLKFEDIVDIQVQVKHKGTKSITYRFDFKKDGELIAQGEMSSACCICNPGEKIRAIPIPESIAMKIVESRE